MRESIWTMGIGAVVAALSLANSARAEEGQGVRRFGSPGFIVSADRLLPLISYQSIKTSQTDGSSNTRSSLSMALANNGPYSVYSSFSNLPRLGFDWTPVQNFTLGGTTWLYMDLEATDSISPAGGGAKSTEHPKVTYWGFAPRVGYVVPMTHKLSLWPRAGVEYHHVSYSGVVDGLETITQFSVQAEVMLVVSPWNHFGFMVGPTADIPISGEQTRVTAAAAGGTATTTKSDSVMFQAGMSAGMLGHF